LDKLLEVKGLRTQFFTQEGTVNAVNGISFDLGEGETLGIVGESGCGKSVSMLSIMRLVPEPPGKIVGGQVMFQGKDLLQLDKDDMRKVRGSQIAMIFQDPMTSMNPVLTVERQLTEAMDMHLKLDRTSTHRRAVELLEMVNIPEAEARLSNYPHQFSGGMRQRVMIATALSCNPKLLIADEPTTALDVTVQAQIVDIVRRLRRDLGMSIIWITHDLGIIAGLADRVQVMYAGYIVERADVRQMYRDPRHPYTLGLLGSLTRVDAHSKDRLTPIEGRPPDLIDMPPGCPFHQRCTYRIPLCLEKNPALSEVSAGHEIACWVDTKTGGQRS